MTTDVELLPEEALAWAALHRLGRMVGCDHADGPDGISATENCVEAALLHKNQRWDLQLWGWPWFGCGKLTLQFVATGNTYTYWAVFLTTKLSLAIHVGGKTKASTAYDGHDNNPE